MIEKGDYAIIFDLKPGYHHVADYGNIWNFHRMGLFYIAYVQSFTIRTSNNFTCIYQVAQVTGKEIEKQRIKKLYCRLMMAFV